jgi:Holliday junction DNA helicase RuvB
MATPSKRRLANSSPAASTPVERIIAGRVQTGEDTFEGGLRPRRLEDYVGQARVVENLRIAIRAAQGRNEPLDHILFHGPPGLGKTTLAFIMAAEMGVSVKVTAGPSITRPGDLAAILTNLQPHDLLFVDEFHRLPRVVEEVLYPVMEDRALHIVIGKGPGAHTVRLSLPPFTLTSTRRRRLPRFCAAPPASLASRPPRMASRRWPSARAAPRALPTASCGACGTTLK